MNHDTESPRGIRSFVIRAGRVTDAQRRALDEFWPRHGIDFDPGTNVVEVHINRLRGKIDKGFEDPLIQTVRGRGYVLKAA